MIQFKAITEDHFDDIINMKRPDGEQFVAPNSISLAQACYIATQVTCIRLRFVQRNRWWDS